MKQLKLRGIRKDDIPQVVKWLNANPLNSYDPRILDYPTLKIFTSYGDNGNVCHLPIHQVYMMESIARNPEESDLNVAQALRDLTKATELAADAAGIREVYFLGGEGKVGAMAASAKDHSFEELPYKVYRMRLK